MGLRKQMFKSTKASRDRQRVNAFASAADNALLRANPIARIPSKTAQFFSGVSAMFNPNVKRCEKAWHAAQSALALAQLGLIMAIEFDSGSCEKNTSLCQALMICDLVYQGLLLSGFGVSESMKELPENDPSSSPDSSPRAPSP